MRRLIIFLIFLVVSVWAGLEIVRHPGYLLLAFKPWMIQMPVWFALLCFVVFFVLFYLLLDSMGRLGLLWFRLKHWWMTHREHRSYQKTERALAALIEGRYKKAEKLYVAGTGKSIGPLRNYLGAAKAAHEQGAYERRDRYLQKAYKTVPKAKVAIALVQAELEIAEGKFEQAIATLQGVRDHLPYQPQAVQLLEKIYLQQSDWKQLQALLPAIRKSKKRTREAYQLFEADVYSQRLSQAGDLRLTDLRAIWADVPRTLKKNPAVVYAYVCQLYPHMAVTGPETKKEIEALIRHVLRHHWHPQLAVLYGDLSCSNVDRSLVVAGAWLKRYGPHPELLLTLGKLCMQAQLWGKAKEYFEKCLAAGPSPSVYLAYGQLLERLDKPKEALQKYREGLYCCNN